MISARGVRKRFGKLPVLNGLDLDVERGSITAIVGPNASGKTTFNRIILGLVRADGGEIRLDNRLLDGDARYREQIGYMPQIARYPENLSGRDVMSLVRDVRGDRVPRDEELIDLFTLGPMLDKPLRLLSGGMRQRINAALAFLFRADLLILDEPTAGLDPVSAGALKDKMRRVRDEGRTIIVTSHVLSELDEVADRIAFLLDGVVRFSGSRHELLSSTGEMTLERAVADLMLAGTRTGSQP
jgi:Cu-processing system ATP-binding protein